MSLLELILIFVLQFEAGISGKTIFINNRAGHDATLTCNDPSDTTCSTITWLYNRYPAHTFTEVQQGNFEVGSGRAARMSLDTSCSLVINNITAEDVGLYTCRQWGYTDLDVSTYLSVLTISPSPADADPKRDDEVTLECSLLRYTEFGTCKLNSIRWVDETGAVLRGKGVGYEFLEQLNCASYLLVKRQSGHNRRYTCQVVDKENNVEVQADYTPDFKGGSRDEEAEKSNSDPFLGIILGAVFGMAVVLVVITAVLIRYRKRAKVTEDVQKPSQHPDDAENSLTYVTVSHANQLACPQKKVKEEEVTYSIVKTAAKTEADNDPSSLYIYVS
ncbi:uncharacterized protein LOC121622196 [Chelmon rostratus]|uniref:uncharacterized protein LOC121622196 n=1 Tax=Chelmon rostratus TaxID=109905 RepID=UPI001BECD41B|nr:uncharacterized protein LOC121622196 [Chelmon rostratus]